MEDAQQAMRLARAHASEWHIDSNRIGVIGFSAGAHLAAVLSTHPDFQGKNIPASPIDARPDFQMIIYPGWLSGPDGKVSPSLQPTTQTPPTFLLQAENDYTAHVENALVYFQALKDAKIPAELHLFTQGGHGFGLRPTELPISRWPALAEAWLHTIHILGPAGGVGRARLWGGGVGGGGGVPDVKEGRGAGGGGGGGGHGDGGGEREDSVE